ncbi:MULTISPECIES: class I SAM-dependent methyltransferase [unclassified Leifsonia]|uniref:class I SAM-dependent methyltransferase n=1 Tax=unclassified Leifsonia TaxID=2663824 RepID=UPI0006FFBFF3|nr:MULTISPECIES: class I SAM-dependent methyltransferase [unclassified Leifsonia]KQX08240.1 hypothetical protein ASC59_11320 [Leifsonia sp. Root1293]KRA12522.1 hypothetical protein ASD61_11320 [Leifsonia sp. Root60]
MEPADTWRQGGAYDRYIGRWSSRVADLFLSGLDAAPGLRWLDVGCGTGALTEAILDRCSPSEVTGIEPSAGFRSSAIERVGTRARILPGDAQRIPLQDASVDVVVSGLVLNFVPDAVAALTEMTRVATDAAIVGAYVWDYSDGMEIVGRFWEAAAKLDSEIDSLREATHVELCRPDPLLQLFSSRLSAVEVEALDLRAEFRDFDDYWTPFLGGQGPAPAYAMALDEQKRVALREGLRALLIERGLRVDRPFTLGARAWAVRGRVARGR